MPPSEGNPTLGEERLQKIVRMHMQSYIEASEIRFDTSVGRTCRMSLIANSQDQYVKGIIQIRKPS